MANGLSGRTAEDAEADTDEDGLDAKDEYDLFLDPLDGDTDGDGESDSAEDPDFDGLTNAEEIDLETMPTVAASDDDGASDEEEVDSGTNPLDQSSVPSGSVGGSLGLKGGKVMSDLNGAVLRETVAGPRRAAGNASPRTTPGSPPWPWKEGRNWRAETGILPVSTDWTSCC